MPFVTVNRALLAVTRRTPDHEPHLEKPVLKPSYSGDRCLRSTVTCGADVFHPSGTRKFTVRELACLQGFPLSFRFPRHCKTELRRQIGNAVPPVVYEKIVLAVKRTLDESDARYTRDDTPIDLFGDEGGDETVDDILVLE